MLTGQIIWLAGPAIPDGYLEADGSSLLRAAYPNLFAAIGTAYGFADPAHFNLPDLREACPLGPSLGMLTGMAQPSAIAATGIDIQVPGSLVVGRVCIKT